jgi:putative ABC transport system ATP-binding protein
MSTGPMDKSIIRYTWKHTRRQQLWILFIVLASMPTFFLSLDLPKQIVNGPIQGRGFEDEEATQLFLRVAFDVPQWLSSAGQVVLFPGFELDRLQMLMALSFSILALVIINGAFKFYINTYKGRLGERMLRRLRYELVDRVLRFPPSQFKRVKASEIATMIKDEVEPLGGFIGDAFVSPVFLGGQALTALIFILVQSFWLGMIAGGIVAVQGVLIPKLRRRQIELGRQRQLTARELAGRVGEIVDGIAAVHVHDTSNYERAEIAARLGKIFKIRYDLYQYKFMVKFLNNFLAQVTPFLFYAIGGYFALRGRLDIGQLVAVIAAYKDLPTPIKELIDWDQQRLNVEVKFAQVAEQFDVERMMPADVQALRVEPSIAIESGIAIQNLSALDDSGARLLERVTLDIRPGEKIAVVGTAGGGTEALAEALARLLWPDGGRIGIEGRDLFELPESVTGRRIAYAASEAQLFQGTVSDNLLYVLKHAPLREVTYDGAAAKQRLWEIAEARSAGNPEYDIRGDWVDYAAAGVAGPEELFERIKHLLEVVNLSNDIFDFGLRVAIDPDRHPTMVNRISEVRESLRGKLEEEDLADLVEFFTPGRYNSEATVAENLLFGTPVGPAFAAAGLVTNPYFRSVLKKFGLDEALFRMGLEIARTAVELFRDLPPDHPFFQQLTFMSSEEIPEYQALLQRVDGRRFTDVPEADRERIIRLSFHYIEPRFRFGLIDEAMMKIIVDARHSFHEHLPEELKLSIERYAPGTYNKSASLLDNVLFGRIGHGHAHGAEKVGQIVRRVLDDLGLSDEVFRIGLEFNVGVGGRRLMTAQRQKLHVARALLKRADILVFSRALSALDSRGQDVLVRSVLAEAYRDGRKPTLLWVLSTPGLASLFDRVLVMDRGTVVEQGKFDDLMGRKGVFAGLISS